ncbi:MAG: bifunctional diaminohydroxyphosphoribosylaminopyrimidine deaminase/5-amino-6-(5-phosphoribosylamino)uracil reductase RibD [Gammaproteobacteria bacterium]|nr:bifunctional diaminohydroxyphosphoribosylaminopyrimidine deaminase/5-amino-6-(5-phosphoribosylamino)uracil reductase RibD [Gammaproteobacteria bacterium]
MNIHLQHMLNALRLAEQGRETVSPNPMVGCIIAQDDRVMAQGFHQRAGEAHAEVCALQALTTSVEGGATMYVTLEPCCHHGRTPPCTTAIIKSGIKKIFVACLDPNPLVAGKGVAALRQAGIAVEIGLCESEAKHLNEVFFYSIQHRRPFVIAKWAMSLDGKTITHPADACAISGEPSLKHSHAWRACVDAILVGAKTACLDNPHLTVRYAEKIQKQPLRIVLTTRAELPSNLHLFDPTLPGKTLIVTTESSHHFPKNIEVCVMPKNENGKINLGELMHELDRREIRSVLVEGGMMTHHQFFQEKLVNKVHAYIAPVILGDLEQKQPLTQLSVSELGADKLMTAYLE